MVTKGAYHSIWLRAIRLEIVFQLKRIRLGKPKKGSSFSSSHFTVFGSVIHYRVNRERSCVRDRKVSFPLTRISFFNCNYLTDNPIQNSLTLCPPVQALAISNSAIFDRVSLWRIYSRHSQADTMHPHEAPLRSLFQGKTVIALPCTTGTVQRDPQRSTVMMALLSHHCYQTTKGDVAAAAVPLLASVTLIPLVSTCCTSCIVVACAISLRLNGGL